MKQKKNDKKDNCVYNRTHWQSFFEYSIKPPSAEYLKARAAQLLEWVKNVPDAVSIEEFLSEANVPQTTWYGWLKKSPELAAAHDYAKTTIGARRERKGLEGTYNSFLVGKSSAQYLKRYEDAEDRDAQKGKGLAQALIKVVTHNYPDSPLVPDKISDNETLK